MALFAYDNNTITVTVAVRDSGNNVVDITGATLEAAAMREGTEVDGTCAVTSAADGIFKIDFGTTDLAIGDYNLQARMTLDGLTRVVCSETLQIRPSLA